MEVSFSTKPHALSAITCVPFSSSYSPGRVRLLRGGFLGSAHSLRPSGLHSRRKCKNLGFQFRARSPNLILKASIDSQSAIVVVAVVTITFSLLTVVYYNYSSKRKLNVKEMSRQLNIALSQQMRSILNWSVSDQLQPSNVAKDTLLPEKKNLVNKERDCSHDYEDNKVQEQCIQTDLVQGQAPCSTAFESVHSNLIISPPGDFQSSSNSRSSSSRAEPAVMPESNASPFTFSIEASGVHLNGDRQETEVYAKSPMLIRAGLNATSSDATCIQAGATDTGRANHGHSMAVSKSSFTFTPTKTARKELHTFFEASSTNLYSLETFPSQATVQKDIGISSTMKRSIIVGSETSSSDNFIGKLLYGGHEERILVSSHDSTPRKGFPADNKKHASHHNSSKSIFPYPTQKVKHVDNGHHPSRKFSAYNQFLREGRLTECIQMLEELESKGLLDMDKVYHSGFFQACRKQKAVRDAFRFTQLIPNPTLSTFNMLMSVCASSRDSDGAFRVLQLVREAGLKADCKLYTTLISTCARSGKVDTMFEVFHEMVNAGVEPNVHTYGALIDGSAKAGQVAKAFGAYGILRSKNVKPDRVVFNALITACGQSGAVDRAFDVLGEMRAETQPIDPDHITIGALMKACGDAGQVERARQVYHMLDEYKIEGTPEVYTIAINSCCQGGDWEFACRVYDDMIRKAVPPDEMLISALIDVAGHAGDMDAAFGVLEDAKTKGLPLGVIAYSSLMGACCNAKSWEKALDLYEDIKTMNLKPTVPMMNALITALCDADQLHRAVEVLLEMKSIGLSPNTVTYSILLVASEKKDDIEIGLMLLSQAKKDAVVPNLVMCRCLIAMCLRRFNKACKLGEPVLSSNSGRVQIESKWTSIALRVYRETIAAGVAPTAEELSLVLGCLQLPHDAFLKKRLIDNLGLDTVTSKRLNLLALVDGFGEYDPRAFSLLEEATSLGMIPVISFRESPIVIDVRDLQISTAEVYILAVVRALKHRLAAGTKLPNLTILVPMEKTQIQTPSGEKSVQLAGRITQAVTAMLRRLGLSYQGNASHGKIRILGVSLKKWLQPKKQDSSFSVKPTDLGIPPTLLVKEIMLQQRRIRSGNLTLD